MLKQFTTIMLSSLISLSSVNLVNLQPAYADHLSQDITVYSITKNQHGRILKTSVGTFYLGKSEDAIHEVSGRKSYGYWKVRYCWHDDACPYYTIYIGNRAYFFAGDEQGKPYMSRIH